MNFAEEVKINRFRLPEECEKHAGKYHEIADALAIAKSDLSDAEDKLKLIYAQREQYYRLNWDDSKWGKITEGSVKAKVESDDEVQEQKNIVSKLQREVNIYDAARSAFEHRKSMLNNLVSLMIGSFYAAPEGGKQESRSSDKERALREKRREMNEND